jgi:hypothetical protein
MLASVALFLIAVALLGGEALACRTLSAAPHSRWSVDRRDGIAWLINPCGERFFSIGVNVIDGGAPPVAQRTGYYWKPLYPDREAWARATRSRLLS